MLDIVVAGFPDTLRAKCPSIVAGVEPHIRHVVATFIPRNSDHLVVVFNEELYLVEQGRENSGIQKLEISIDESEFMNHVGQSCAERATYLEVVADNGILDDAKSAVNMCMPVMRQSTVYDGSGALIAHHLLDFVYSGCD